MIPFGKPARSRRPHSCAMCAAKCVLRLYGMRDRSGCRCVMCVNEASWRGGDSGADFNEEVGLAGSTHSGIGVGSND